MKTNKQIAESVIQKAKTYKAERAKLRSTIGVLAVLIVAVMLNNSSLDNIMPKFNASGETNLSSAKSALIAKESNVMKFASKDELIDKLEFMKKESKFKEVLRGGLNTASDMVLETAMPEGAVAIDSKQEVTNENNYSKTNTQVQGVDEADIVKTDGKRIYYLSRWGNFLSVTEDANGKLKEVKKLNLQEKEIYPNDMYLTDDSIIIIGSARVDYKNIDAKYSEPEALNNAKLIMPRYYYRATSKVLIYSTKTFECVREIEVEGNILSTRKVDDNLYIVTNKNISLFRENYQDEVLPVYKDSLISGEYLEIPANEISYIKDFDKADNCSYMLITSLNVSDKNSKLNIETLLGAGNEIYCSRENLYVTKTDYNYSVTRVIMDDIIAEAIGARNLDTNMPTTSIHKFSIKDGKVIYVATGKVEGTLLNQFSMDEYDEKFRITTTSEKGNNLFVLDDKLEQIGSVENLASGEKIYATRFMGDKAYVVTYKTVDPLFVIDLSTPTAPKVLGELKIPGYSTYLHPLGQNYLLGLGQDSIEKSFLNWEGKQEVRAYENGMKLSIFDVSDYSNPKELHTIKIGGRGSISDALNNHKAIMLNEEEGIIAFPAELTEDGGYYDDGTPAFGNRIFTGGLVYNIDPEEGISLRGKMEKNLNDYNSRLERIIYIGNKLYSVSTDGKISSYDMKTLKNLSNI